MNHPNIVFIMADDMGYWTPGFMGNSDAVTPHMDDIARQGVVFENFYCASPVCSPARASILTGRMPSWHGVLDWVSGGNMSYEKHDIQTYLEGQRSYVQYLSNAGYQCGISGKWHLGNSCMPQQGFTHWYVHQLGGGSYFDAPMIRNGRAITQEGYITHAITEDAVDYIKRNKEPFYLSVHYTAPHTPWCGHPKEYTSFYNDCSFCSCPDIPYHPWQVEFEDFCRPRHEKLSGYFAASTALDEGIGNILKVLEEENKIENTLIIFTSDNGFSCGHHGIWGKGNGTRPFNMYDPAVRVPFVVCWPGKVVGGRRLSGLYSALDIFPSILKLAGISHTESDLPGSDFSQVLLHERAEEKEGEIIVYDEYGNTRMLRNLEYKYIFRFPNGPCELYNMISDPEERHNIVHKEAATAKKMEETLKNWFSINSRMNFDGLKAGVTGAGQNKKAGESGFTSGTFGEPYPLLSTQGNTDP